MSGRIGKGGKSGKHITAFYLETLLLVLVLIAIILVLSRVFGLAREKSARAGHLTSAVSLASNAAEAFNAAENPDALFRVLDEDGNAVLLENGIEARYDADRTPNMEGELLLSMTWSSEDSLTTCEIVLSDAGGEVYRLRSAAYRKEGF